MITKYNQFLDKHVSIVFEFKKHYNTNDKYGDIDVYITSANNDIVKEATYTFEKHLGLYITNKYETDKDHYNPNRINYVLKIQALHFFYFQYNLIKLGFTELINNKSKNIYRDADYSVLFKNNKFSTINNLLRKIDLFDEKAIVKFYDYIVVNKPELLDNELFLKSLESSILGDYQYIINAKNFNLL